MSWRAQRAQEFNACDQRRNTHAHALSPCSGNAEEGPNRGAISDPLYDIAFDHQFQRKRRS